MASHPRPHALVFPLPAQGHINPLLRFSVQLALRGFIITFVNTESCQKRMLQAQHSQRPLLSDPAAPDSIPVDIRFVTIPDASPDVDSQFTARSGQNIAEKMLDFLKGIENQRGPIEKIIDTSKTDLHPISCIVDSFLPWTQDLANKNKIGRIVFWTSNGTILGCLLRYRKMGKWTLHDHDDEIEDFHTSGLRVRDSEFLPTMRLLDIQCWKMMSQRLDGAQDAVCIAVNSFEELESYNLRSSYFSKPIRYIGPLMPFQQSDLAESKPIISGDLLEAGDCLDWLSKQKPASVLYVCFGSVDALTTEQIQELALGIEESEEPFLWVARATVEGGTVFPEGFIERTRGRGLIIGWAPQLKVLEHPATAAFVTHCGWNSTLESLYMGVPMLCFSITVDQPMNEVLIAKQWRAGVAMVRGEDGLVRKEEVVRAVKAVMESKELRDEATRWKQVARKASMEGGSSHTALECLIRDLEQFQCSIPMRHCTLKTQTGHIGIGH